MGFIFGIGRFGLEFFCHNYKIYSEPKHQRLSIWISLIFCILREAAWLTGLERWI